MKHQRIGPLFHRITIKIVPLFHRSESPFLLFANFSRSNAPERRILKACRRREEELYRLYLVPYFAVALNKYERERERTFRSDEASDAARFTA